MHLSAPVESIPRISAAYTKRLNRLGIRTVKDLFYHFPHRYDDLSKIARIADIKINETVTVIGEIINVKTIRTFKKKMFLTEALIKDASGTIRAVWYNQPFLMRTLKKGTWISLAGKATYNGKTFSFSNPAHELLNSEKELRHTGGLIPVYPETARLTSRWLRYILKLILPNFLPEFKDFLPSEIKKTQNLIGLNEALQKIHLPKTQLDISQARRRLGFDEIFLIQLFVLNEKIKRQNKNAPKIKFAPDLIKNFVASLPFKLTNAQRKAAWEILQDLEKPQPMNRLLEGDVGSGKTVVAAIAALETAETGFQAAFMAPTEILANQHFQEISKLFYKSGLKIGLLTASESRVSFDSPLKKRSLASRMEAKLLKKDLIQKIKQGAIQVVIGTHALIQKNIQFKNLALVIVDEQHRFGVNQRAALQKSITETDDGLPKTIPHLLSMTATPIPRTLTLTIYGDLDLSLINEMPKGRQKILTKIVPPSNRQKAYDFIREQIKKGQQAFVICPRIEASDNNESETNNENSFLNIQKPFARISDIKTVTEEYEKLSEKIFPDFKIGMLHGKLKAKEKEKIMKDFIANKINILVSTSVVEVGIDIPNATVMMIEGSERFGLAQLYQFKGRVGRGKHQSYCFLFTESSSATTSQRLKAISAAKNGFELAEKDLAIRGPGEFYGMRQWGLPDLAMASLTDTELIKSCREEAEKLLAKDLGLKNYPLLQEKLKKFQEGLHLE